MVWGPTEMNQRILSELCQEAVSGALAYASHYALREGNRPTPRKADITFILCADAPEVLEENTERDTFLVWGTVADGRIAHILIKYHPVYRVVTAYFPAETEPYKWADDEYRIRIRRVEQ